MSKKFFLYKLSNHTASGHQLESCTLKGFDPYIYTYIHTKVPTYIYIHLQDPSTGGSHFNRSALHCLVWRDPENHQESAMGLKIIASSQPFSKSFIIGKIIFSFSHFRHQLKKIFQEKVNLRHKVKIETLILKYEYYFGKLFFFVVYLLESRLRDEKASKITVLSWGL